MGKLLEMIFTDISEIRFVGKLVIIYRHFNKPTDRRLFKQHDKSSPLDFTHYAKLYPQDGDRIGSVTSLDPMYSSVFS